MKVSTTLIVWIRITNESDNDRLLMKELHKYTMDHQLFPAIRAGGGSPGGESHGYSKEDADKILQWLKDKGATEDTYE